MKAFVIQNLLRPALDRIASQIAMFLGAAGLATGEINTVVAAVTILTGLAVDFVLRKVK